MSAIFISYTGRDPEGHAWAVRLSEWFREWEYVFFCGQDHSYGVKAGDDWRRSIYSELGKATAMVCLCSKQYERSPWCVGEVAIAMKEGKPVIPIMLVESEKEPIHVSIPLLLREYQAIRVDNALNPKPQHLAEVKLRLHAVLQARLNPRDRLLWDNDQVPYQGLAAFEEHQAPVFFGRDTEIATICERLCTIASHSSTFFLLLGAAGSGKTSLVRAGVIPRLKADRERNWIVLDPFRPGLLLLEDFKEALAPILATLQEPFPLAKSERKEVELLRQLDWLVSKAKRPVVVVIDQLESLLEEGDLEGEKFLNFLELLLQHQICNLVVLGNMRTDSLAQLQKLKPMLAGMVTTYHMPPITPENFGVLIAGPARRADLSLEPGLESRLVMDSGGQDALPLLACTLEKLWQARKYRGVAAPGRLPGERWDLTVEDYELIGGIQGIVAAIAENCWVQKNGNLVEREAVRDAFLKHLVSFSKEDGRLHKRAASMEEVPPASRKFLLRMLDARLLALHDGKLMIAHEALIRAWPPLVEWIHEANIQSSGSHSADKSSEPEPGVKDEPIDQDGQEPTKDIKIVLVGRGGAGKTSLIRRLKEDSFDPCEPMTRGIHQSRFNLRTPDGTFRLNIWDFGGQESMHATHQFFLTRQTIYLLVLQGREGNVDAEAEYWLNYIEAFGADSQVLVVLNKIDECAFDLNFTSLLRKYRQCQNFVKTDCKENKGIEQLTAHLGALITSMPRAYSPSPCWSRIRSRIEKNNEVIIPKKDFYNLCSEEGLGTQDECDKLARVFHLLGFLLYYGDDHMLKDIVFVNPARVANGIYSVLTSDFLAQKEGELDLGTLFAGLNDSLFPVEMHQYLLRLMRRFGLCFPCYTDDMYLIPELLGESEPSSAHAFHPEACLNYEFHYAFLPHGLIPRLIVQTHTLSSPKNRWRKGIVLSYANCKALIIGDSIKRLVTVRIMHGQPIARREFLGIIRAYIKQIHHEFSGDRLDVLERVPLIGCPSFSVRHEKLLAFERQGIQSYPEFDGVNVIDVNVSDLLNGVETADYDSRAHPKTAKPKHIFISYSHKDELYRAQLETHLTNLRNLNIISFWHDRMIMPSSDWESEIDENLKNADIVILLISSYFLASDYCMGKEVHFAMERHYSAKSQVVPIIVRPCDCKGQPFEKIQGLPMNLKPITRWKNRDAAWLDVSRAIRSIAEGKMKSE